MPVAHSLITVALYLVLKLEKMRLQILIFIFKIILPILDLLSLNLSFRMGFSCSAKTPFFLIGIILDLQIVLGRLTF